MVKLNITKEQAISILKWSVEAGADEVLNETSVHRLIDRSLDNKIITDTDTSDPLFSDTEGKPVNKILMKPNILVVDEEVSATDLANQCHSVSDLISSIKDFPHFKLANNKNNVVFYNGSRKASVLIFKEPEIYSAYADDEINSDAKKLLFNRISNSIDTVLSDEADEACGSIVTFPEYFDSSEEVKDYNFQLIRPFLIRFVKLIQPQAIILMDGFLTERLFDMDKVNEEIDFMKEIEIVTFPSLDVLLRAPKRKRDVWNIILDLKMKLRKEE